MKKSILFLCVTLLSSALVFSQQEKKAVEPVQFTKVELLGFADVKALLTSINKGQDYSKYMVRNFNLCIIITNPDGTTTKLSEMGPGGTWSEKQKALIEKYAKAGASFTIENVVLVESGKKGVTNPPVVSFSIK